MENSSKQKSIHAICYKCKAEYSYDDIAFIKCKIVCKNCIYLKTTNNTKEDV